MKLTKGRSARALRAGLAAAAMTAALAASPAAAHADIAWTIRKAPLTLGTSGLTTVTAAGPSAIWAGGYQWQSSYVPPYCGEFGPCSPRSYQNPVLQSGDGAFWSWIGTPGMTGSGRITALDAVSATDVWAAGPRDRSDGGSCGTPYLAHLSGGAWNEVSAPPLTCFFALDADGAGAWAAGYADRAHGGSAVYRWSGAWTPQDTGAMDVRAIRQRTPDDVWAVGAGAADTYDEERFYAARFDGSAWHDMTPPQLAGRHGRITIPGTRTLWAVGKLAGKPYVISTG